MKSRRRIIRSPRRHAALSMAVSQGRAPWQSCCASLSNDTTTASLNKRRAATSVKIIAAMTFCTHFDYLLRLYRVASSNTRDMSGAVELPAAVSTRTRRSRAVACA